MKKYKTIIIGAGPAELMTEKALKHGISFVEKAKNSLSFLPQNEWNLF